MCIRDRGAHAQLAPDWSGVLHGAVVVGGEHEADTDFVNALPNLLRCQIDIDAQRFEYVGTARLRGNRTSAVLGDAHSSGSGDEHGGSGNIESLRTIATGAARILSLIHI